MYIWESEWKKNKLEIISKVLQFLNKLFISMRFGKSEEVANLCFEIISNQYINVLQQNYQFYHYYLNYSIVILNKY